MNFAQEQLEMTQLFLTTAVLTQLEDKQKSKLNVLKKQNIAGRVPENSRHSFVDLQSHKNSKNDRPKKIRLFIEG